MKEIIELLLIFIFGAIGTLGRYLILKVSTNGLLYANSIGIVIALIIPSMMTLFISGFCGSLTSFSSFIKNGYFNYNYIIISIIVFWAITIFLNLLNI